MISQRRFKSIAKGFNFTNFMEWLNKQHDNRKFTISTGGCILAKFVSNFVYDKYNFSYHTMVGTISDEKIVRIFFGNYEHNLSLDQAIFFFRVEKLLFKRLKIGIKYDPENRVITAGQVKAAIKYISSLKSMKQIMANI